MKFKTILIAALLISAPLLTLAQPPHPPGGGHGNPQNQPAAGAPVGEGLILLWGLAGLYGGKKIFETSMTINNKDNQVNEKLTGI